MGNTSSKATQDHTFFRSEPGEDLEGVNLTTLDAFLSTASRPNRISEPPKYASPKIISTSSFCLDTCSLNLAPPSTTSYNESRFLINERQPATGSNTTFLKPPASLLTNIPLKKPAPQELRRKDVQAYYGVAYDNDEEDFYLAQALNKSLAEQAISNGGASLPSTQECITCLDELPISSFPSLPITSTCNHPTNDQICKECLRRSFRAQLDGGISQESGGNFKCPLCRQPLSDRDTRRWADPDTFRRFNDIRTRNALANEINFVWCSNASCGAGQIHASGADSPIMTCNYCQIRTCFTHQRPWHEGLTCYEFDHPEVVIERERQEAEEIAAAKRREDDIRRQVEGDRELAQRIEAMDADDIRQRELENQARREKAARLEAEKQAQRAQLELRKKQDEERQQKKTQHEELKNRRREERLGETVVRQISKVCPGKQCSYRVYRDGGCRHMTCTRCRHEWCWDCLQPWKVGHLNVKCT